MPSNAQELPIRWRLFNRIVQDIKTQNVSASADELQRIVDDAAGEVRAERRTKRARKA